MEQVAVAQDYEGLGANEGERAGLKCMRVAPFARPPSALGASPARSPTTAGGGLGCVKPWEAARLDHKSMQDERSRVGRG
jgi:hypothetical protein